MSDLELNRDGWLETASDDPEVTALTRLRIRVAGALLTRNVSKRGGGESEAINTSLLPLAEFVARNWWPLLYEPVRPDISDRFRVRHRLDSGMRGFTFPALALWSGGDDSLVADWATFENRHAAISFLTARPEEPLQLARSDVELALMDMIGATIERAGRTNTNLLADWERIQASISTVEEMNYCIAAGKLGIDPYDPEGIDLSIAASGLSDALFGDVTEIVEVDDLALASDWLRGADHSLKLFPETDISSFGPPVDDDLAEPAWVAGVNAAHILRVRTGVPLEDPRRAVGELLDTAISESGQLANEGPVGISGVVQRSATTARIGTIARSAKQRRFRACATAYMAWSALPGEERAATDASTRRQQASRAFAAEMLAPIDALVARAPRAGFDDDDLIQLAHDFICPYETVKWQSFRAGIRLRGIATPSHHRERVITSAVRL